MKGTGPTTLLQAIQYFADEDVCIRTLSATRWPDGVIPCPACGHTDHYYLTARRVWKCKLCKKQFSIKVGTIMEDSAISLTKWLPAIWLITNAKNGISSYEVHRSLGVTQKTAWFMLHRIRLAMKQGSFEKLGGSIEIDESWIGGRRMYKHKHKQSDGPFDDKDIVLGILERDGEVRTFHVPNTRRVTLEPKVRANVADGSKVYSDANYSYNKLGLWYQHGFIDHAISYVEGLVHTNGLENYWSLLKRTLKGTYTHVESFHLSAYLDEQAYRFNHRFVKDADRFNQALTQIAGKRVTYSKLTGKS